MRPGSALLFAGLSGIAVAAAVAAGIAVTGTPGEVRQQRLDAQRVADLRAIAGAIDGYRSRYGTLPAGLEEMLRREARRGYGAEPDLKDPVSGQAYEYRATGASTFELCARFDAGTPGNGAARQPDFWRHGPGRHCFALEAAPARPSEGRG